MSWRDGTSALRDEVATSRALNLDADAATVQALCAKQGWAISAVETLLSGGTRVVMRNGDDAARLRVKLKAKLINGTVQRAAWAAHRGGA
ncbi:hypothetical protein [Sphingomonas bacterium]|uniref:hypothetical protein n=1 Tax=Sphingomonas bacterium TaxID=1895847 RepID=UPI0020C5B91D|nr:hypothetical protein [Sphingomonas bacterium]